MASKEGNVGENDVEDVVEEFENLSISPEAEAKVLSFIKKNFGSRSAYMKDYMKDWRDLIINDPKAKKALHKAIVKYEQRVAQVGESHVFPERSLVLNALTFCPPSKIKAVIVGQDPIPDRQLATGLAFSLPRDYVLRKGTQASKKGRSIREFKKALIKAGIETPANANNYEHWAKRGVLMLNARLTIEQPETKKSKEKPKSSKEKPKSSKEEPESSKDESESSKDEPESSEEEPESSEEESESSKEEPESSKEKPKSSEEEPESSKEKPGSSETTIKYHDFWLGFTKRLVTLVRDKCDEPTLFGMFCGKTAEEVFDKARVALVTHEKAASWEVHSHPTARKISTGRKSFGDSASAQFRGRSDLFGPPS